MTIPCRRCGDGFTPSRDTYALFEDGWIDLPDICPDCGDYSDEPEIDEFSDADPSL